MPYAVAVTFSIKPERLENFLRIILQNARESLRAEAGCHQFDVATDPDRPGEVFLYEIYSDRAAFDAHLASPHFRAFDVAAAGMIANKTVASYRNVAQ